MLHPELNCKQILHSWINRIRNCSEYDKISEKSSLMSEKLQKTWCCLKEKGAHIK